MQITQADTHGVLTAIIVIGCILAASFPITWVIIKIKGIKRNG